MAKTPNELTYRLKFTRVEWQCIHHCLKALVDYLGADTEVQKYNTLLQCKDAALSLSTEGREVTARITRGQCNDYSRYLLMCEVGLPSEDVRRIAKALHSGVRVQLEEQDAKRLTEEERKNGS